MGGIFYYTGRGLNWDMYGHNPRSSDPMAKLTCTPDTNGYNTLGTSYTQINYFEWCQDHNKPCRRLLSEMWLVAARQHFLTPTCS